MPTKNKKVVTRFAPSPTGYMHIGGVRTALYAWAYARKHDGIFILRIEDTDKEREVEGSIGHIIESLKWIGISWDEGVDIGGPNAPYIQSQRLDSYKKYAKILIDKGLAYADPYTLEELDSFRKKSEEEKKPFLYRNYRPKNPPVWDGSMPLRLKIVDIKRTEWTDLARGQLSAGPEALDDFVLIKSDGYPTYNFAHIIDDLEMGVTHIMRADEFISSIPKFLALYDALNIERPEFVTLPPIMGLGGNKKLGKRDGAKDILEYRDEGYLPEAMMNFLALIGWNPGTEQEVFTESEFINAFDISHIQKSGGQYNEEKLDWLNREHLKRLSYEEQEEYVSKFIPDNIKKMSIYTTEFLHNITPIMIERNSNGKQIKNDLTKMYLTTLNNEIELSKTESENSSNSFSTLNDDVEITTTSLLNDYRIEDPLLSESNFLIPKNMRDSENSSETIKEIFKKIKEIIDSNDWKDLTEKESKKNELWNFATSKGRGTVLWPLRVALSGRDKSPDPFEIMNLIGRDASIRRINNALKFLNTDNTNFIKPEEQKEDSGFT